MKKRQKRILSIVLVCLIATVTAGCSSQDDYDKAYDEGYKEGYAQGYIKGVFDGNNGGDTEGSTDTGSEATGETTSDPDAITIEDVPANIEILPPNSIGTVYADVTYTNNTPYPVTSYQLTVLLKDSNEKQYYSCYDTVLPGETSPKFSSFGPKTGHMDDIQFLEYEITLEDENGERFRIEYDCKLGRYK